MNQDLADMLQVVNGDQKALGRIYDRYGSMVFAISLRVLRDEDLAQEVTQDVFLAVWQKAHRYDPKRGKLSTWLGTMARSRSIDRLRKIPSEEVTSEFVPEINNNDNEPEDKVLADVEVTRLRDALDELTPLQRECLELMYFRGLKQTEIAAELGVPLGTIKARIFHSLNALRGILEERDNG